MIQRLLEYSRGILVAIPVSPKRLKVGCPVLDARTAPDAGAVGSWPACF